MEEKPKSIWKKSWTGWRGLLLWFILFFVIFLFGLAVASTNLPFAWLFAIGLALAGVLLVACIRSIFCWRNFKRFLFDLACFATLIALFYAEEDWRGKHDWEKFKRAWEAKGDKFDFKDFVQPPVPDDQNFAMTPVVASCYGYILTRDGKRIPNEQRDTNLVNRLQINIAGDGRLNISPTNMNLGSWTRGTKTVLTGWQRYYRDLATKTNLFPVSDQPQSPAADVLLALSRYDATIEELRTASQLPYSRFPLNYDSENPGEILLPHLAVMKSCTQVLQLRAIAELQHGQPGKALADVRLMLRLTDSFRSEPFLISQLVRIGMTEILLQPVYEGLAEHRWSDAQLALLDAELGKPNFLADFQQSVRGEVGFGTSFFEYLRSHRGELFNFATQASSSLNAPPVISQIIPSGWFYQNQLRCARMLIEHNLPTADPDGHTASPQKVREADAAFHADIKHLTPYNIIEKMLLPALADAVKKFAREQISVDLARTAIALERYRLAHAEFPESLDALAPQFIAKVPHDVIGGLALKYRRTDDGQFVLYSIGWNEKDDGGVMFIPKGGTQPKFEEGDWVWRYAAK